jgi:hypothetical protein
MSRNAEAVNCSTVENFFLTEYKGFSIIPDEFKRHSGNETWYSGEKRGESSVGGCVYQLGRRGDELW